jgi:hypothetical protein
MRILSSYRYLIYCGPFNFELHEPGSGFSLNDLNPRWRRPRAFFSMFSHTKLPSPPRRSPLSLSKSRDSPAISDEDPPLDGPSALPPSPAEHKADDEDEDVSPAPPARPFGLSLTLQNTGSVARDHLASERTFLAYVRTSLSFASAGVGTSSTLFFFLFKKNLLIHVP